MTRQIFSRLTLATTILVVALASVVAADPLSTAFTYQGRLNDAGGPAEGLYDFQFIMMDAGSFGNPLNEPLFADAVPVHDGTFTVDLNFGEYWLGDQAVWLEILVRPAGEGPYTTLAPRQPLLATPFALEARSVIPGAVGAEEIDPSQVQRRVSEFCSAGETITRIHGDGTVSCGTDADWLGDPTVKLVTAAPAVGLNVINPEASLHINDWGATHPALLIGGASASEGDLAWPEGETFHMGSWHAGSDLFTQRMSVLPDGTLTLSNGVVMPATTGDKLSLYDNRLGQADMYGFGISSSTLYYKANGAHAWFIQEADPGAEAATPDMILTPGGLAIGTSTLNGYRLAVNGKIRAKEIVVESGWADFVFEEDYRLRPLDEVRDFIDANGHLPDVPSAAHIAEHGVRVGEIDATLLQKIEELTLYVLDLDEEVRRLRAENASLAAAGSVLPGVVR